MAVSSIVFINLVVFLLWNFFSISDFGLSFMIRNFLVSWNTLLEGRFWTLLTCVFSHNNFLHFFLNMYVLTGFAPLVEKALGKPRFLQFYLVAGIFSSLCHTVVSAFVMGEPALAALGASGAVSAVIVLFSFLFPGQKLLILGLIPVPAMFGVLIFVGLDMWGLIAQARGGGLPIGHGAHLGGALVGLIYYLRLRKNTFVRV